MGMIQDYNLQECDSCLRLTVATACLARSTPQCPYWVLVIMLTGGHLAVSNPFAVLPVVHSASLTPLTGQLAVQRAAAHHAAAKATAARLARHQGTAPPRAKAPRYAQQPNPHSWAPPAPVAFRAARMHPARHCSMAAPAGALATRPPARAVATACGGSEGGVDTPAETLDGAEALLQFCLSRSGAHKRGTKRPRGTTV